MHKSEVLHGELLGGELHTGWGPHCGRLLRQWHTLVGPRCHLGLQAGVLGLLLLVDLGLVSLYAAYISVKKGEKKINLSGIVWRVQCWYSVRFSIKALSCMPQWRESYLQMAFHFIIGQTFNLHQLPDLFWCGNCNHHDQNITRS